MFRRRGLARAIRGPRMGMVPPAVRLANERKAAGDFNGAAEAYEQLAHRAVARNGPHAPMLLIQSGRMRLQANDLSQAMVHFQQGLGLLAASSKWQRFYHVGQRLIKELSNHGYTEQAAQIETLVKNSLPAGFTPAAAAPTVKKILPTNCPGCGGVLHSDEVEWSDEFTAECPFCGNAVRVEG